MVDSSLFYIRTTLHGVKSGEFLTLLAFLPKKSRVVSHQHEPRMKMKMHRQHNLKSSMLDRIYRCRRHFSLRAILLLTGNDSGRHGTTTKSLLVSKHRTRNFARPRYLLASGKTLWIFMMVWPSMKKLAHKKDIDIVLQELEEFCVGNKNEIYERYMFNKRDQAAGESIDTYVASLRPLSKTCSYGVLTDNLIRDRVVVGILDKGI